MLPGIPPPSELLQMIAEGKDDFTEWEIASVDQLNTIWPAWRHRVVVQSGQANNVHAPS